MAKVAQVRTRKCDKNFSYIFEAGKTADDKRKVVEKGSFATKLEAYKASAAAYNDLSARQYRHYERKYMPQA